MGLNKKEVVYIPIQEFSNFKNEDDLINISDLIKTLLKNKKIIIIVTSIITILGVIYALLATPVYKIKANIQTGKIIEIKNNGNKIKNIINPVAIKILIISNFDKSNDVKTKFPKVSALLNKENKNIIKLSIKHLSNKDANNSLNKILSKIREKENEKITIYKKNIKKKIKILSSQANSLNSEINNINTKLNNTQDNKIYEALINAKTQYHNELFNIKKDINNLQLQISPASIDFTHIIGKIFIQKSPIKPKKKLIVIISFISGFILSVFLVFFLEFIKDIKRKVKS